MEARNMKYIYLLLWFSFANITKADRKKYEGYERAHLSGHVVGGVQVPITMYPHVAVLVIQLQHMCGGSIVSHRLIVTAGHCVVDTVSYRRIEPEEIIVFLGSTHLGRGSIYEVCKVIPHELYVNNTDPGTTDYFYDIAVLMLSKRIKFGPTIRKVEIAPHKHWKKEKYYFTIAGFGLVDTNGIVPSKLRAVRMHYVDSRTCNQSQASSNIVVPRHMFCMIGLRWTSDCQGDSGSGVIWRGYIVGLVSSGRDTFCGSDMMPSMYTDVTYFTNWVHSKIKEADSLQSRVCQSSKKKENV